MNGLTVDGMSQRKIACRDHLRQATILGINFATYSRRIELDAREWYRGTALILVYWNCPTLESAQNSPFRPASTLGRPVGRYYWLAPNGPLESLHRLLGLRCGLVMDRQSS